MSDPATTDSELTAERLAEMVGGGAQLIDVRRPYEWEAGRIAGARHIEMNELTANAHSIGKDRPVIFYCRTGNRSGLARDAFREAGYDAYNLAGGIEGWVAEGRELDPKDGVVRPPLPAS
ncbi:MAG TPA: rhodanese-like domain-containing protein [Solirubrobacterales bacterium]|nr:rhodanese-like domain-containing protein [Solirubrobacterales bacterium]